MVKAPKLLNRTLTFDAMLTVEADVPFSVVFGRLAADVEEAPEPLNVAVTLFSITVMGDSDP